MLRCVFSVIAGIIGISVGALADAAKMRFVKISLGEQLTGELEGAFTDRQRVPFRASWPICFFALLDSHTKLNLAAAVPTAGAMQKALRYK
jgi:hypothetical protein